MPYTVTPTAGNTAAVSETREIDHAGGGRSVALRPDEDRQRGSRLDGVAVHGLPRGSSRTDLVRIVEKRERPSDRGMGGNRSRGIHIDVESAALEAVRPAVEPDVHRALEGRNRSLLLHPEVLYGPTWGGVRLMYHDGAREESKMTDCRAQRRQGGTRIAMSTSIAAFPMRGWNLASRGHAAEQQWARCVGQQPALSATIAGANRLSA